MFIDKETRQRVNIYAPYKGRSKLETAEERAEVGVIEIPDPTSDADVDSFTHYIQEVDYPPYLSCVLKSQKQIVDALNSEAKASRVAAYVGETDPLFFKEQRGEVEPGAWASAVASVKAKYPKYPEVVDG